jgi:hypothetical protein
MIGLTIGQELVRDSLRSGIYAVKCLIGTESMLVRHDGIEGGPVLRGGSQVRICV